MSKIHLLFVFAFLLSGCNLTVDNLGGGTVISDDGNINCGEVCSFNYDSSATVTLTATPDTDYEFGGWVNVEGCGESGQCVVDIGSTTGNKSVKAHFYKPLTLDVENSGGGFVSGTNIECGDICQATFRASSIVINLEAQADLGYEFVGWGGACMGQNNCELVLNQEAGKALVTAQFIKLPIDLSVSHSVGGNIISGDGNIDCGDICQTNYNDAEIQAVLLNAIAESGYVFSGWGGGCSGLSECVVDIGITDILVTAQFTQVLRQLSVISIGNGIITSDDNKINCSASCQASYSTATDHTVTLVAMPQAGYQFDGWSGDCSGIGTCNLIIGVNSGNKSVSANFSEAVTLTVVNSGGGVITSNDGVINCGDNCVAEYSSVLAQNITLSADPDEGYQFNGWSGACEGKDTCNISFDTLEDISLDAVFKAVVLKDEIIGLSLSNNASCGILNGKIFCWGGLAESLLLELDSVLDTPTDIDTNSGTVCAILENVVHCWDSYSNQALLTDLEKKPITNAKNIALSMGNLGVGCALTIIDTVICWGNKGATSLITPVYTLNNIQSLDMGVKHACVLNDKTVECWGDDTEFKTQVPVDLNDPLQLVLGAYHSCVLQKDSTVRCWGSDSKLQSTVPEGLTDIQFISAGLYHTCAVGNNGKVTCWGNSPDGELDVPSDLPLASSIVSGGYHVCADTVEGLVCWGRNDKGQASIWYNVTDFAVGESHVCGINEDKVQCFGSTNNNEDLLNIPNGIVAPKVIGASRYNTCVWADSGMHCWGSNSAGESVPPDDLSNITEIDGDEKHLCAISDKSVVCWGNANTNWIPTNLNEPTNLSIGKSHDCLIDGSAVRCWGDNYYGQSSSRYNLINPKSVTAGGMWQYPHEADSGHTCFADDNGVTCYGSDVRGNLDVPLGLSGVVQLHSGWAKNYALDADGNIAYWGDLASEPPASLLKNTSRIEGDTTNVCGMTDNRIYCWSGGNGNVLILTR